MRRAGDSSRESTRAAEGNRWKGCSWKSITITSWWARALPRRCSLTRRRLLGKSCLVIDRRPHIAGNIYTKDVDGINVHEYGAHIFHTSMRDVWDYVNRFAEFNNYVNSPVAVYKDTSFTTCRST